MKVLLQSNGMVQIVIRVTFSQYYRAGKGKQARSVAIKGAVEVIGLHGALRLSWSIAFNCWRSILTILQGSVREIQGAWKKKNNKKTTW